MLFRHRRPGSVHHQCGPLGRTKNYESGALGLKAVSARALCRVVRRMAPEGSILTHMRAISHEMAECHVETA